MGIALSKLMESIGMAVQNANLAIEHRAAISYLEQGYEKKNGADGKTELYQPITYNLDVTTGNGKKKIEIPATILKHHHTLQLEQVEVKLKFQLEESAGQELMVKVSSQDDMQSAFRTSELSMQFKTAPPAEGTARLENRHVQIL